MRSRNGITRVGLLVVVAIAATGIGLLVPSVRRVRSASAAQLCVNNLKQLALAFNSWRTAHPGPFEPFARPENWNAAPKSPYSLLPYFENDAKTMMCPTVNPPDPTAANYGINDLVSRINRVSFTSGTILFAEYAVNVAASTPDDLTKSPWTYANFSKSYRTNVQARHPAEPPTPGGNGSGTNGIFNIAFVDGHVDTVTISDVSPARTTNGISNGDLYWNNYLLSRGGGD